MHYRDPHGDIARIFQELLPARGLVERTAQISLAHQLLDALLDKDIALCDAGTGIGKTYAYLAAGVVFQLFRENCGLPFLPVVISTSSIPLQRAIQENYLPLISDVMSTDHLIREPLRSVIRKGKTHYVCDERLLWRLRETDTPKSRESHESLLKLLESSGVPETDGLLLKSLMFQI